MIYEYICECGLTEFVSRPDDKPDVVECANGHMAVPYYGSVKFDRVELQAERELGGTIREVRKHRFGIMEDFCKRTGRDPSSFSLVDGTGPGNLRPRDGDKKDWEPNREVTERKNFEKEVRAEIETSFNKALNTIGVRAPKKQVLPG